MIEAVKALTAEYDMLPRGGAVLCAVSGGADSMCLLHLLSALAREGGFRVSAAHYNHSLRGAESDRDAAFVAEWCALRGIPCVERSVMLGYVSRLYPRSICVAGTHGKTTATSMITSLL